MASTTWPWRARVPGPEDCPLGAVHDGDTLWLLIDRGFDDLTLTKIRLLRVFAPELRDAGGTETRDYVSEWLRSHHSPSRWPFWLDTTRTSGDVENTTLGRYLGTVWTADRQTCLNADVQTWVTAQNYGSGIGKS